MKQTDEELIEQIKRRDEKAFEYIVKIYGRLIKSIVSKHMYNLESYQDDVKLITEDPNINQLIQQDISKELEKMRRGQ